MNDESQNVSDYLIKVLEVYRDRIPRILESESKFSSRIFALYQKMLGTESEFSLSYGFERYINCFREFVFNSTSCMDYLNHSYAQFIDYTKSTKMADVKILGNMTQNMLNVVNKLKDVNADLFPYCEELKLKYIESSK